jgi:hypothetical protein
MAIANVIIDIHFHHGIVDEKLSNKASSKMFWKNRASHNCIRLKYSNANVLFLKMDYFFFHFEFKYDY